MPKTRLEALNFIHQTDKKLHKSRNNATILALANFSAPALCRESGNTNLLYYINQNFLKELT